VSRNIVIIALLELRGYERSAHQSIAAIMILMAIATATATLSRVFTREKVRWLVIKQWTFLTINPYIILLITVLNYMRKWIATITALVIAVIFVLICTYFRLPLWYLLWQVLLFLIPAIMEELVRIIIDKVKEWLSERDTVVIRI
jgi:hypothetical protein